MDLYLTAASGIIQLLLAGLGVYVALNPHPATLHKKLIIAFFVVLGLVGISVTIIQQHRNEIAQQKLQARLDSLDITGKQISTDIVKFHPTQTSKPERVPDSKSGSAPYQSTKEVSKSLNELKNLILGQRWGLNAEQLVLLTRRVSPYSQPRDRGDLITCILGDPASTKFALNLVAAFRAAGWKLPGSGYNQAIFSGNPEGVIIKLNSKEANPPAFREFVATMREAGIEPTGEIDEKIPLQDFQIIVGRKPDQ